MTAGAFIFAPEGPRLTRREKTFFRQSDPWGFILFARNVGTPDQLRALTEDLRAAVGRDAPVFIDQEGGRVARLEPPNWRAWPPPLDDVARLGTAAGRGLALRYAIISAELRAVGIDGNCAPVCDIARDGTHPVLRNRCLGTTPGQVADNARHAARAMLDAGVLPVIKHMPGQGRALSDSHLDLPQVEAGAADLMESDFQVFRRLNDLPLAMTAHVVYSALDPLPATVSRPVIDLIRAQISFQGLLMTDDIAMQALSGDVAERGAAALSAGCDLVLHCNGRLEEMTRIATLGPMSQVSAARAGAALAQRHDGGEVDIDGLVAEYDALQMRAV